VRASWLRIALITLLIGAVSLGSFTAVAAIALLYTPVSDWAMAPEINAGDIVFGLRTSHPHPDFGDTVLYVGPSNTAAVSVGRVAGIPGDSLLITGGRLYRNETEVPFFHGPLPVYDLHVAGAGIIMGNEYLLGGAWPRADRWTAPDRIPEDCYFILANDTAAADSHQFGFVPGSTDGPCASARFPRARIITRVINSWPTGITKDEFLARRAAASP